MSPLENLPPEMIQHILGFLETEDQLKIREVSKLLMANVDHAIGKEFPILQDRWKFFGKRLNAIATNKDRLKSFEAEKDRREAIKELNAIDSLVLLNNRIGIREYESLKKAIRDNVCNRSELEVGEDLFRSVEQETERLWQLVVFTRKTKVLKKELFLIHKIWIVCATEIENGYKRQCNERLIDSDYSVVSVKKTKWKKIRNFYKLKELENEIGNYFNANWEEIVKSQKPFVKSNLISSTADAGVAAVSKKFFLESRKKVTSDIAYRLLDAGYTANDVRKCC